MRERHDSGCERSCASFGSGRTFVRCMGDVVKLADRRRTRVARAARDAARRRASSSTSTSPARSAIWPPSASSARSRSVIWRPASAAALERCDAGLADRGAGERSRRAAERRAADAAPAAAVARPRPPQDVPAAMRAAVATRPSAGRGAAFVLAAGRLAFCGGFDLDDPEILAEAAAAAGIGLDECLRAAGDVARDGRDRGATAGDCSPRAPTACRRCESVARCSGARRRSRHARHRRRRHSSSLHPTSPEPAAPAGAGDRPPCNHLRPPDVPARTSPPPRRLAPSRPSAAPLS